MDIESLPKACVILGAGASYDIKLPQGATRDGPEAYVNTYRPPLVTGLFDDINTPIRELLRRYPGAGFLRSDLMVELSKANGGFAFEEKLKQYSEDRSNVGQLYRHIPAYLRDLLWACSKKFVDRPNGYDHLVMKLLWDRPHQVLFLVTNYDTLLEQALSSYHQGVYTFGQLEDYLSPGRQAKVAKLHGSVNWFVPLPLIPGSQGSWRDCVASATELGDPGGGNTRVIEDIETVTTRQEIGRRLRDYWGLNYDPWLYPVLTAPIARKSLKQIVHPGVSRVGIREFLCDCQKFLIIGHSGMDDDVHELLDQALLESNAKLVHFVGKDQQPTEQAISRFKLGVSGFAEGAEIHPSSQGFQSYLSLDSTQDGLDKFANAQL